MEENIVFPKLLIFLKLGPFHPEVFVKFGKFWVTL